jgi:hypothetical protein
MRLTVGVLAFVVGCTNGWPEITDVREMGGSLGGPSVDRIRDMANPDLPVQGALTGAEPDGVATPGELLLVEGSGFGKQPTVRVGGRPAAVLARTDGGGVIVRVPTGIATGSVRVEISTPRGHAEGSIPMRRFGLVAVSENSHVHILEIDHETHPFGHPLGLPGAQKVRFSHDGSTAYVVAQPAGGGPRLHTIDMTAPQGPRLTTTQEIPDSRVVAFSAADSGAMLAIASDTRIHLVDISNPRRPSRWPPLALAEPVVRAHVVGVALDPDGKTLAVLSARGNQVRLYDITNPRDLKLVTTVDVLPDVRAPVVRELQFSIDGETLWVVSGDNAESLTTGPQPTRLTAIRLLGGDEKEKEKGPRVVSVWRTMAVPGATAPIGLAVSRGQPVASGTTIRIPPEKAAVFISGVHSSLFQLGGLELATEAGVKQADAVLRPLGQPGMMIRADINGGGGPIFSTPQVLGSVDLSPDAQVIVATACRAVTRASAIELSFGIVTAMLWGNPSPRFVPLEKVGAEQLRPPLRLGEVRIQP